MKLVRDRIGDIPWSDEDNKRHLGWVERGSPEHRALLVAKLREEAEELIKAFESGARRPTTEEAADVYEVIRAMLWWTDVPAFLLDQTVLDRADFKLATRGGFYQGRTYDGPELK